MDKTLLKQIVIDQAKEEAFPRTPLVREAYQTLARFVKSDQVIVLSGVRRCGKSTWMKMICQEAEESNYYLNFDDERLAPFQLEDCQRLVEVFIELYGVQNTFYFDEMQNFIGWERFVRRLHNEGKKVFVTGSNAKLLSRELGTHLTGRHYELHLYPYSFREYMQRENAMLLTEKNPSSTQIALIKKHLSDHKQLGGFPKYLETREKEYLHGIYENILYKDVIVRHKIENVSALKGLAYYLASNNTKEFTYNSLRKLLGLSNTTTVSDYCHYLEDSFLCFTVNRYAYSVRKQMHSPKKIYFIDSALAECVGFRISEDSGRVLENIIYLQLKRQDRHRDIYYHKEEKECDFLICKGFHVTDAIQVCSNLQNAKTRKREIAGLLDAMRTHKLETGLLITEEESGEEVITEGKNKFHITIMPAWQWLITTSG